MLGKPLSDGYYPHMASLEIRDDELDILFRVAKSLEKQGRKEERKRMLHLKLLSLYPEYRETYMTYNRKNP